MEKQVTATECKTRILDLRTKLQSYLSIPSEKHLYNACLTKWKKTRDNRASARIRELERFENMHRDLCYDYLEPDSEHTLNHAIQKDAHGSCFEWESTLFTDLQAQREEEDAFLANPIEIEEGVVECKCGSKKTYSYQLQTRSGDEGITSFVRCVDCNSRWKL